MEMRYLLRREALWKKSAYFTVLDIEDGDLTVITKTGRHYSSQQDILAEVTGSDLFRSGSEGISAGRGKLMKGHLVY